MNRVLHGGYGWKFKYNRNRLENMRGLIDSLRSDEYGYSFEEKENKDVKEYVSNLK